MMKDATVASWVFINLLLNEGTFMLAGEELIVSLFLLFLPLNILLLLSHFFLCSLHERFSFLLGAEENDFYYTLNVQQQRNNRNYNLLKEEQV